MISATEICFSTGRRNIPLSTIEETSLFHHPGEHIKSIESISVSIDRTSISFQAKECSLCTSTSFRMADIFLFASGVHEQKALLRNQPGAIRCHFDVRNVPLRSFEIIGLVIECDWVQDVTRAALSSVINIIEMYNRVDLVASVFLEI